MLATLKHYNLKQNTFFFTGYFISTIFCLASFKTATRKALKMTIQNWIKYAVCCASTTQPACRQGKSSFVPLRIQ